MRANSCEASHFSLFGRKIVTFDRKRIPIRIRQMLKYERPLFIAGDAVEIKNHFLFENVFFFRVLGKRCRNIERVGAGSRIIVVIAVLTLFDLVLPVCAAGGIDSQKCLEAYPVNAAERCLSANRVQQCALNVFSGQSKKAAGKPLVLDETAQPVIKADHTFIVSGMERILQLFECLIRNDLPQIRSNIRYIMSFLAFWAKISHRPISLSLFLLTIHSDRSVNKSVIAFIR